MSTSPVDDLLVWLREQLDEDERLARTIELRSPSPWRVDVEPWATNGAGIVDARNDAVAVAIGDYAAEYIVRWPPSRVLREVEAKRKIVDLHTPAGGPPTGGDVIKLCPRCFWPGPAEQDGIESCGWSAYPCVTLCALALPYSDRPGYRQEWVP
jgi:hypothetical protein